MTTATTAAAVVVPLRRRRRQRPQWMQHHLPVPHQQPPVQLHQRRRYKMLCPQCRQLPAQSTMPTQRQQRMHKQQPQRRQRAATVTSQRCTSPPSFGRRAKTGTGVPISIATAAGTAPAPPSHRRRPTRREATWFSRVMRIYRRIYLQYRMNRQIMLYCIYHTEQTFPYMAVFISFLFLILFLFRYFDSDIIYLRHFD